MLDQERLKQLLSYDPEIGEFRWIAPTDRMRKKGAVAGFLDAKRYRKIKIDGVCHYAHRLAWLYVHGEFPKLLIDHCNLDPSDNRMENLLEATYGENVANSVIRKSKTGYRGVKKNSRGAMFSASIMKNGRHHFLGNYKTKEDAAAAYNRAARSLFGAFARAD